MKRALSLIAILIMIMLNCVPVYGAQSVSVPVDIEIQDGGSGRVQIQGNGLDEIIDVKGSTKYYFKHEDIGEYYYTVKQLPGTDSNIEYDDSEYTVYIYVYYPPKDSSIDPHKNGDYTPDYSKLESYVIIKKAGDDKKPDKVIFASINKTPDDPDDLEKTNTGDSTAVTICMLVMAVSLWAFILLTIYRERKRKEG